MMPRRIHSGACSARFFSKNTWPGASVVPTPSTQRLRVTGRPATCGHHAPGRSPRSSEITSPLVVPVSGYMHLVEVRQPESAAVDLDELARALSHDPILRIGLPRRGVCTGCVLEACEPSGRGRSHSASSMCPSSCTAPPKTTTCRCTRCTTRTAGASATSASARSAARSSTTSTSTRPTTTASSTVDHHRRRPAVAARRAQPRDRGRRVRAERPDRPDHVRPQLLPRARLGVVEGLRAAAPHARVDRPHGDRAVRAAAEDAARGPAGARRRAHACRPCSGATRCARPSSRRSTSP